MFVDRRFLVLPLIGIVVAVVGSCLGSNWVRSGDLVETLCVTTRELAWGFGAAVALVLGLLGAAALLDRVWPYEDVLRLEQARGRSWIVKVRRTQRSGAEKVLDRHDITRTVSVSHVNGDAVDTEECVQLHDREPEIRMGLFGEVPTVEGAELLARVEHNQLVGQFGRDLAAFLRSRPLARCEYSLYDDALWRVLSGHEIKPVEPGITFNGENIVWRVPERDADE